MITNNVEEPKFGDQFDFKNIFRIKGKKGLYYPIAGMTKQRLIRMCEIYQTKNTLIAKVDDLVCLGDFQFIRIDGSSIGMAEVFTNLSNYAKESEDYAFEGVTIEELMPFMCPKFDKDKFKKYHSVQVLGWYIEITLKYSALIDSKIESGEVELLTEENK